MRTLVTARGLARDAANFLNFRRAMGVQYHRGEFVLNGFVLFIAEQWGEQTVALDEAIRRWSSRVAGRKAVTVSQEFGVVRQLCLYRRRTDPRGYVPEHALAPVKESPFLPYIFSHEEVLRLLHAASSHRGRWIWGPMFRALMLVLYCTGLRLGEAVHLNMEDVDLRRNTFLVSHSKGRSRIVAFRPDLARELHQYLEARRQLLRNRRVKEPQALFIRLDGTPLTVKSASEAIRRLLRQLAIKPPAGRIGPRPYEFRHAFAVHRLTAWASTGVDVHAKLPLLSAYLGHQDVLGTEVYLKATPQLLDLASRQLQNHLRHAHSPE
ncbi:tyrosine-type recombinase/integrase (plasmid) [Cupriavidus sp. P-10]|uniref:tyrosine-type recombinase/integrase n=1 Tax=unclassified Cupriavidus TaxID=2640874 RepID=UPI000E2E847C|nr:MULTISPECIES: tyrosine-type recombinase/integrase [unclassified Cupriavidus]BDB27812.1 tyrosine-type recombinase/integrase [Cupriavidus sp. P-10]BDB29069.1 tyrosine-type recombinase/integrase [Cupriavidus sp. P-10]BDB29112.1 tyrosine-type recombinase/integrase [Cupriavidus sp. P-10]BDB29745.1 tyrosine-type recombinase/integrase [Cupriavidus sp. P-10]